MKVKRWLIISLVVLGVIWWQSRPDGRTRIVFCDVGQGDGIVVIKNNFQMLIDTGPDNKKMAECLDRYLPFWEKRLEAVIITHKDKDHIGGLESVKAYYRIAESNIFVADFKKGDLVRYGEIEYETLSPDRDWGDENKNSVAGILKYHDMNFLLMADVPAEVEQKMVWRKEINMSIDVLKVSHHGSREGTSKELLEMIMPEEAVISVGRNNSFGHPAEEVIGKLTAAGVKIRRTDIEGDVVYVVE